MASDREFTHPDFGTEVRVEVHGRDVCLTFVANSEDLAIEMANDLVGQLKRGALNITLLGKPTSITRE